MTLVALGGVVVDLLVRPRGEEAGEGVADREQPGERHRARPARPCPARRCRTRRSARGSARGRGRGPVSSTRSASSATSRGSVSRLHRPAPRRRRRRAAAGSRGGERARGGSAATSSNRSEAERLEPLRQARLELLEPALVLLRARRARVEAVQRGGRLRQVMRLHEGDAGALEGVGDQQLGPLLLRTQLLQGAGERARVVPVAAPDRPAERLDLALQVAEVADLRDPGVGLELVVVDDHRDLAEARGWRSAAATPRTAPPGARRRR